MSLPFTVGKYTCMYVCADTLSRDAAAGDLAVGKYLHRYGTLLSHESLTTDIYLPGIISVDTVSTCLPAIISLYTVLTCPALFQ